MLHGGPDPGIATLELAHPSSNPEWAGTQIAMAAQGRSCSSHVPRLDSAFTFAFASLPDLTYLPSLPVPLSGGHALCPGILLDGGQHPQFGFNRVPRAACRLSPFPLLVLHLE